MTMESNGDINNNENNSNGRREVIDRLVDYVIQKLPKDEIPLVQNFIRLYFLSTSPEDLTSKSLLDLYGAVISHWKYISERKPGQAKVRVYNPDLEQNGWQTPHTVIEIGFDDMPFLVDSISMELNRMGLNIHLIIHMGNIKVQRDANGLISKVAKDKEEPGDWITETAIYIEIDKQSDEEELTRITKQLYKVISDVKIVVDDWKKMEEKSKEVWKELRDNPPNVEKKLLEESLAFIQWLSEDHFTFMGT